MNNIPPFSPPTLIFHSFPSKEQASFNFLTVVIVHSEFEIQESLSLPPLTLSICNEVMGQDVIILLFLMLSGKPAFHSPFSL